MLAHHLQRRCSTATQKHSSAWRYNVQSALRHHQSRCSDYKPLRRLLLGGGRVNSISLQGSPATEGESRAVAYLTRASTENSTSPAEGVSGSPFCPAFRPGVLLVKSITGPGRHVTSLLTNPTGTIRLSGLGPGTGARPTTTVGLRSLS